MKGLFITWNKCRHTLFYCTLLWALQILFCFFVFVFFFTNWKFALSKYFGTIFPTAFAHFMSLSHFGNSYNIFIFLLLLYFLWCDYCDQWSLKLLLRWWLAFFLAIRYILIKVCMFFRHNAIAHLLDCGIV